MNMLLHGVKDTADFTFLLHGFHYLKEDGVMAIILPHGVLFRGGAEERIRTKLLKDGHIDTVIAEKEVDLQGTHAELVSLEKKIKAATERHNDFLKELGLPLLPMD